MNGGRNREQDYVPGRRARFPRPWLLVLAASMIAPAATVALPEPGWLITIDAAAVSAGVVMVLVWLWQRRHPQRW